VPPAYPFPTPLPVIPGAFLVRILGQNSGSGTPVVNQLCWQAPGGSGFPTALAVATAISSHWGAAVSAICHTDYQASEVGVYDLSTAVSVEQFAPCVAAGNVASVSAPPNITARASFKTAVRRKHGSTNFSPISDADIVAGSSQISSVSLVRMQNGLTSFLTAVSADAVWGIVPAAHSVLSKITGKLYDGRTIAVTSADMQSRLGSQRRRRGY